MIRPSLLQNCRKTGQNTVICNNIRCVYNPEENNVKLREIYSVKKSYETTFNKEILHKVLNTLQQKTAGKVRSIYKCSKCNEKKSILKFNLTTFHYTDHRICEECELA